MNNNFSSKVKLFTLLTLATLAVFVFGAALLIKPSESKLSGKVTYSDKSAVEDAVINILAEEDLSLVASGITETDGTFRFEELVPGEYYLSVQLMDQTQKVYGPFRIEDDKSHLVIKPLTLPVPAQEIKVVVSAAPVNTAS